MATFAEALATLIWDKPDATVEIRKSGGWCTEHEGAPFIKISVNGEVVDHICPTALDDRNYGHFALFPNE
jgi:hypothetical protein